MQVRDERKKTTKKKEKKKKKNLLAIEKGVLQSIWLQQCLSSSNGKNGERERRKVVPKQMNMETAACPN